jgi:NTP pyrophosphatase (non-canonical NTP hydrolase)
MDLNTWRDEVHDLAREKGWYDHERKIPELCMLITCECAELVEAYRKGQLQEPCDKPIDLTCIEEEIADILIRTLDMAGAFGVDVVHAIATKHNYNIDRPKRHGGKLA